MRSRFIRALAAATAVAVGLGLAIGTPAMPEARADGQNFYVDQVSGVDSREGKTPETSVKTLTRALKLAAVSGGHVVFMRDYKLVKSITEPAHSERIVLTNWDGKKSYGATLIFDDKPNITYNLAGPTTFQGLRIKSTQAAYIAANFNKVAFGKNVVMEDPPARDNKLPGPQMRLVGGHFPPPANGGVQDRDPDITVESGRFSRIIGFSLNKDDGEAIVYKTTSRIRLYGAYAAIVVGGPFGAHRGGNTSIHMTAGSVQRLLAGGDSPRYIGGDAKLVLAGGRILKNLNLNNVIGDANVTLSGAEVADIVAGERYMSSELDQAVQAGAGVRKVAYDARKYTRAQIDSWKDVFDVLENMAKAVVVAGATASDCTEAKPCGSLEQAVAKLRVDGGRVAVTGAVPWNVRPATLAAVGGPLRIEGTNGANSATITTANATTIKATRDLTVSGLTFQNAAALDFRTGKAAITIGGDVITTNGRAVSVAGLADGARITIKSGTIGRVMGVTSLSGPFAGSTDITVGGGSVDKLWAGSDSAFDVANARVTVSGGSVKSLVSTSARVTETLNVRLLGGAVGTAEIARADKHVAVRIGAADVQNITAEGWSEAPDAKRTLTKVQGADPATVAAIAPKFKEVREDRYMYVAGGGKGDGTSPDRAMGSIAAATSKLGGGGTVVVSDDLLVGADENVAGYEGSITLMTNDGEIDFAKRGAALQLERTLRSGGALVLQDLALEAPSSQATIVAMSRPLTVGANVATSPSLRNLQYPTIVGGRDSGGTTTGSSVSIASGTWGTVRGGGANSGDAPSTGEVKLTVTGGRITEPVVLGHERNGSGKITADFTGGTFVQGVYTVFEELSSSERVDYVANYDVNIAVKGGEYWDRITPARARDTVLNGSFTVNITGGNFDRLTDVEGTELFEGSMKSTITTGGSVDLTKAPEGETTFKNPLTRAADPFMFEADGQYYFLATAFDKFTLRKVANPTDVGSAAGTVIFAPDDLRDLWSPEIHRFTAEEVGEKNAGWYLYFSARAPGEEQAKGQRQYVLKALDSNDLLGAWVNPADGKTPNKAHKMTNDSDKNWNKDEFVAGMSVIRVGGETNITYVSEVGRGEDDEPDDKDFHQTINMARMKNPWTLTGDATVITRSEKKWEIKGAGEISGKPGKRYPKVVEGATAVYGDTGEVFIAYSGSGYWTEYYAIGYLRYKGGDPMLAGNWEKVTDEKPIFAQDNSITDPLFRDVVGTGTGPTIDDPSGRGWFMYQARVDGSRESSRFAFIEPYSATSNGLVIGDGSGHPAKRSKEYTMTINPIPLGEKISGFQTGP